MQVPAVEPRPSIPLAWLAIHGSVNEVMAYAEALTFVFASSSHHPYNDPMPSWRD
jgi:hypothetical protein